VTPTTTSQGRRWVTLIAYAVAAIGIVVGPLALSQLAPLSGETLTFVIPDGTATRVAAGEDVTIIPNDLKVRQRDRLVLINEDSVTHQVASILIGSKERVETRISEAISLSGSCSLHPSGQISIEVDGKITASDTTEPSTGTR
jgi:hypothetical protein